MSSNLTAPTIPEHLNFCPPLALYCSGMGNGVQKSSPLLAHPVVYRMGVCQVACFAAVAGLIWLNEVYDLAAHFFGAAPSPGEWGQAGVLTVGVMGLGLVSLIPVHLVRRSASRNAITICSYCRRVQSEPDAWQRLEDYFAKHANGALSHGVCPDCRSRVMEDYRAGKKNAGARETIIPEMVA